MRDERSGVRFAVNCSILFTELPLLRRPAAARDAGFDAVEFWWPFERAVPPEREIDAFERAIADAGVTLAALNLAGGDLAAGERGWLAHAERSAEVAANAEVVAGIGERTGCRLFNALYGNRVPGRSAREQDETAVANLVRVAGTLARIGGTVLLEPISGVEAYPLRRAADAFAALERAGADNVALLADLYHLAVNGDDVAALLAEYRGRIGHVQVADAPGRHEPGTGELPLREWLDALRGFPVYVALEYRPSTGSADSFVWLRAR